MKYALSIPSVETPLKDQPPTPKYGLSIPSPLKDQPPTQKFVPFRGPDLTVLEEKPEDEEQTKPDEIAVDSPSSPENLDILESHQLERKGKKSIFRKKASVPKFQKTATSSSKGQEKGTAKLSPGNEGKGEKHTKLSFRKMTHLVKVSHRLSGGASKHVETAEPASPPTADKTAQHGDSVLPQHQQLKPELGPDSPGITFVSPPRPASLNAVQTEEMSPKSKSSKSRHSGSRSSESSPRSTNSPPAEFDEDFFAIQEINMCVHGLWMCVANMGGSVLTFHFKMGEVTTTPKVMMHGAHSSCEL